MNRMIELDQETRDKIIETHRDIKHICEDLKQSQVQSRRLDTRLRRVENLFLPTVAIIGIFAHKVMSWLKL